MLQFLLFLCFRKTGQPLTEGAKVFHRCIDLNANNDQKEYSNNPCNSTRSSQQGSQQPPWCWQQQNCPSYHNLHSTIARSPPIKIEFRKKATGRPSNSDRLEEKRSKRTKDFMRVLESNMWKPNGNKTGKDQHHPQVVWKQKMCREEDRQEKGTDT